MELKEIGWVEGKLPRLVSVQANGCAPIVKAFEEKRQESEFWEGAKTCAFGITVPKAIGDFLVLDSIYKTGGCAIAVSDEELLEASAMLAKVDGYLHLPRRDGQFERRPQVVPTGLDQVRRARGTPEHRQRFEIPGDGARRVPGVEPRRPTTQVLMCCNTNVMVNKKV